MTQEEKIEYINYCKDNNIYRIASMIYDVCDEKQRRYIDDIPLDILKETTLELAEKYELPTS